MPPSPSKSIAEILKFLNTKYPRETAEHWDNVGLLIGDSSAQTNGVILSIDLTPEALDLAIHHRFSLIINHHPCIFPRDRGMSRIHADSLAYRAIQNGIAVAAFHTNFDKCSLEVPQKICKALGLVPQGRLIEKSSSSLMKLVTFVPSSHFDSVREALGKAGAGHIGNYSDCTFSQLGEGTYLPLPGTHPFQGKVGMLEKTEEIRLETIFPRGMQNVILAALQNAHPYEEIAYDFYPVEQLPAAKGLVAGLGYGFWGEFPSPKPFSDLAKDVKGLFNINGFWITNPAPPTVTRVGFVAGKGSSFVEAAFAQQCDLFITGEAGYHTALGACRRGMGVMELGHRESEKFFIEEMKGLASQLGLGSIEAGTPTQKIWSGGTK